MVEGAEAAEIWTLPGAPKRPSLNLVTNRTHSDSVAQRSTPNWRLEISPI